MTPGGPPVSRGEGRNPDRPVLIYDGECSVCRSAIEWVRRRCDPETFETLSCHAEELPRRFPHIGKSDCLEAMHLVLPDGRVLAGEQAAAEIFPRVRGYRWIGSLLRLPGAEIITGVLYRRFAKRRHAISSFFGSGMTNRTSRKGGKNR